MLVIGMSQLQLSCTKLDCSQSEVEFGVSRSRFDSFVLRSSSSFPLPILNSGIPNIDRKSKTVRTEHFLKAIWRYADMCRNVNPLRGVIHHRHKSGTNSGFVIRV